MVLLSTSYIDILRTLLLKNVKENVLWKKCSLVKMEKQSYHMTSQNLWNLVAHFDSLEGLWKMEWTVFPECRQPPTKALWWISQAVFRGAPLRKWCWMSSLLGIQDSACQRGGWYSDGIVWPREDHRYMTTLSLLSSGSQWLGVLIKVKQLMEEVSSAALSKPWELLGQGCLGLCFQLTVTWLHFLASCREAVSKTACSSVTNPFLVTSSLEGEVVILTSPVSVVIMDKLNIGFQEGSQS